MASVVQLSHERNDELSLRPASPAAMQRELADHSRAVVALDAASTTLLLSRPIPPARPAQSWPRRNRQLAETAAIAHLCERINSALLASGFVIVRLALDAACTAHAQTEGAWNLFTCLADPLPHSAAGELLYEVAAARATPPPHRYYSQSRSGGDIHTDATYVHSEPPSYVGLLCLQPALEGGESILVDGRRIYAALQDDKSTLDWLRREYHFDCAGQRGAEATLRRRIFEVREGALRVQYLRTYIASGHVRAAEPLAAAAVASFDALDALLNRAAFRFVYKLNTGDMLLLNNHRMLHGRTAFVDHPDFERRRRLIRLWGQPPGIDQPEP